ncbi:hypothetical protein P154DRAFT_386293, partial [Amniculicola lignicola CBS 123094]
CDTNCSVQAYVPKFHTWVAMNFTTTITAATQFVIVNTVRNTTRTSMVFNDLPSGFTLPPTNDAGTQTTKVTFTISGKPQTTDVAFPTVFIEGDDQYTWEGVLSTTSSGAPTCASAPATTGQVEYFPSKMSQPSVTMITHSEFPDDPQGLFFSAMTVDADPKLYKDSYPGVGAWQDCSLPIVGLPLIQPFSARYMTETSTSLEG